MVSCRKQTAPADPDIPDLPAYTEKGLNTGGAMINNKAWLTSSLAFLSTVRPVQLYSYPGGDSVVLLINGSYKDATISLLQPSTIFIVLKNIHISSDGELAVLQGITFQLDGITNYGGISEAYGLNKTGRAKGSIRFGKVSEISNVTIGDGSPGNPILHPYIAAGHFDLQIDNPVTYTISNGRFDVNIIRSSNQFMIF